MAMKYPYPLIVSVEIGKSATIEEVIEAMIEMALRACTFIHVKCEINGITILAKPVDSCELLLKRYQKEKDEKEMESRKK